MVLDYKGTTFSFQKIRRAKRLKRLRLLAFLAGVILLYFLADYIIEGFKIDKIQGLLVSGIPAQVEEASIRFSQIESSFFHPHSKTELKALLYLFKDDFTSARDLFDSLDGSTSLDYPKFLSFFSDHAHYRRLDSYTTYLQRAIDRPKEKEELLYYRAMAKTGLLQANESKSSVIQLSPLSRKSNKKALGWVSRMNEKLKSGKLDYISDVNGIPLAYYDLAGKKTVPLLPGFSCDGFNTEFQNGFVSYSLTLDIAVQKLIHYLFQSQKLAGTFLLFNVSDSSIIAAYSSAPTNTVFYERYEPGSIVKILTMFAYLKSAKKEIFPMVCQGNMVISGQLFYDWIVHNRVENCEDALAVSCNIAFARMGIDIGYKNLKSTFDRFYFNSEGMKDMFLEFKTGTYSRDISTTLRLANFSVGMKELTITTFHSALISLIISQNGSLYHPHLIKSKKNLLNIAFYSHESRLIPVSPGDTVYIRIRDGLKRAVEMPEGTGDRVNLDFVKVALKTGTAGEKKDGLDALITGFFPAEKPKYAFAFRLRGAGKSEVVGALFLKEFLKSFYPTRAR